MAQDLVEKDGGSALQQPQIDLEGGYTPGVTKGVKRWSGPVFAAMMPA